MQRHQTLLRGHLLRPPSAAVARGRLLLPRFAAVACDGLLRPSADVVVDIAVVATGSASSDLLASPSYQPSFSQRV